MKTYLNIYVLMKHDLMEKNGTGKKSLIIDACARCQQVIIIIHLSSDDGENIYVSD